MFSSGIPVISTNVGGIPEILNERGILIRKCRCKILGRSYEKVLNSENVAKEIF